MRIDQLPASILNRFRNPACLVAIGIYGLSWTAWQALHLLPFPHTHALTYITPFVFITVLVALAPVPWIWTGDGRLKAPMARGILQGIPWNILVLAMVIGILHLLRPGGPAPGIQEPVRPELTFFMLNFPVTLVLGLFLADKERAEHSERGLLQLANQTRAQVLQSQLNPHVLFNILSGLTELVHVDPDAAESAMVALTQLYRELTDHGTALTAPLGAERRLIEHYLDVEEIRLGERLEVEWDWPEWSDPLELPPLLLQPLVENAIKHGISPRPQGGAIRITAERKPGRLALTVANNGLPMAPGAKDGTGLSNLKERLSLMPELEPRLDFHREGDWTLARLSLAWRWNP